MKAFIRLDLSRHVYLDQQKLAGMDDVDDGMNDELEDRACRAALQGTRAAENIAYRSDACGQELQSVQALRQHINSKACLGLGLTRGLICMG